MSFSVGFSKVNINPPLGAEILGYYVVRRAKGFLDDLHIRAMAIKNEEKTVVILTADLCYIVTSVAEEYLDKIVAETGIQRENIFMTATHTHTATMISPAFHGFETNDTQIEEYKNFVGSRMVDAIKLALSDLKPAKMGFATGRAPERIAYIRRYRMKDGTSFTCPPINDPNIVGPIGELDQRIHVLRFAREGARDVVIVNYGIHADTVNGELVSADFPHWLYKTVDLTLDADCMFIIGAQGDVGSTNVHPSGGDMNDTEISFDNEMKSPGMARFVGRAIAGTVLQVFDKVEFIEDDRIEIVHKAVTVKANNPDPTEMPLARKYKELHEQGRDDEIPFKAMQLTTAVADAMRKCRLENGPFEYTIPLMGLKLGPIALVGIPGEPFTEVGVKIKDTDGFSMIMPCGLVNGSYGYFPVMSAYEEGGYESKTSNYGPGVAEAIVSCGKDILEELKER